MAVCARPACFLWQSGIKKKKYIHHRGQLLEFAKKKDAQAQIDLKQWDLISKLASIVSSLVFTSPQQPLKSQDLVSELTLSSILMVLQLHCKFFMVNFTDFDYIANPTIVPL